MTTPPHAARVIRPGRGFHRREHLILMALFIGGLLLRLPHLTADPPDNLSSSRAIYNDGGTYALNARCRLVEGRWIAGGDNVIAQTPGFTLIAYGAFRILGLNVVALRVVSIIGTALSLLLMVLVSFRQWGFNSAVLVAALLGSNFLFVMYGRLELIEGILTGIGTAAMAALVQSRIAAGRSERSALAWIVASACLVVLSIMIKPTGAVLAVPALLFLLRPPGCSAGALKSGEHASAPVCKAIDRTRVLRIMVYVGVVVALLALYRLLFYVPNRALFEQFHRAFQQNASGLWDWRPPVVWFQTLSVAGIWGLAAAPLAALCVAGVAAAMDERDDWSVLLSMWLVTGLLYLAPQNYRPGRFTVLFIPPAAAVAARGAVWLWRKGRINLLACVCWMIYLLIAATMKLKYPAAGLLLPDAAITLLALILIAIGLAGRRVRPLSAGKPVSAALLCATLAAAVIPYAQWLAFPHYSLVTAGQEIRELSAGGAIAGDNWCEALALFHRGPVYKIDWLPVTESDLRRWKVRYFVYDAHETRMPELYGGILPRAALIKQLHVGHHTILVKKM